VGKIFRDGGNLPSHFSECPSVKVVEYDDLKLDFIRLLHVHYCSSLYFLVCFILWEKVPPKLIWTVLAIIIILFVDEFSICRQATKLPVCRIL
jgi:hypothetical protein